ncbi:RHS repeat-associated core domain-containing protein [Pseudomonas moraviensis subsp. stanleyae]|uniref:RHS repeat domain-containing protein n=1 Tax=Pseudomonas moraviensis TaxID=321662 RepID=UPI002E367558|nr:RHS repeat-associated core domain-containing protein [Pseudomonas moraviensis]MED7667145.1 RHS repeat-associated core domain-containing protein [Pseudomonas moraviensis subsp. stanleyae]
MTASLHWRTPALAVNDSRGLPVRQVTYLRTVAEDAVSAVVTSQEHDVAGHPVAQHDPRLPIANTTTVYSLNGDALFTDSVDSGWRLLLPGLAGEPRQRWDERGHVWQSTFDDQLRVVQLEVSGNGENQLDIFTYACGSAEADSNLRGRLIRQKDPSGLLEITSYALTGQALVEKRTFQDNQAFTSRLVFSPLGAVLEQIDAGGHRRASRFGLAGQLRQMELQIQAQVTQVLQDTQYNANNQIIAQLAGNGVLSQWTYDPTDGRLHMQTSGKTRQSRLQDLEYFYDRVGNIIRIEDHAFEPTWFANQRVDGHREFSYDSLYRLIRATGHDDALPPDIPGLPQPPNEKNRLNYTQTYSYDDGGNLTELRHQRDGNSRTRRMYIDDQSNRAVRWETGDEVPDFDALFDLHGNQHKLRHGPSLHWNSRDELQRVELLIRQDSDNDAEYYQYSQGQRVFKCHEWFTDKIRHFHQVRYLPGLEIRSKDNGEELHIISLGNARCLHWAQRSTPIDDQMRYTLEDHLGSCVMELNEDTVVTSAEGYYPFGETAWMAPESEIEYRFIRYSGKEMDVSGLYYYGARYYAPWLQRWISTDAEQADGLNLYAFVGNNPIRFVDPDGNKRAEGVIMLYSAFASAVEGHSEAVLGQLHSIIHQDVALNMAMNLAGETLRGVIGYEGGSLGGTQFDTMIPALKVEANVLKPSGLIGGNIGGDVAAAVGEPLADHVRLRVGPLIPQTSQMSVGAIDQSLGIQESVREINSWKDFRRELLHPALNAITNPLFWMNRVFASVIPIIPGALNMGSRAQEAQDIKNRLDPVKIEKIEKMLSDWKAAIEGRSAWAENAFDALGVDSVSPTKVLPNANGNTSSETLAVITRSGLQQRNRAVLANIAQAQAGLAHYKEMGSTDNQYLARQRHRAAKKTGSSLVTRFKNGQ